MQRPLISRIARTTRSGFTLIELVVVVAVLVILAGLILPNLGVFKLKANKGVAASNMHGVTRFVESYRIQKDLFPDKFDSLLTGTPGTAGTALYTSLDPQLVGPVVSGVPGSPTKLTTTTIIDNNFLRSLSRMGITTVMDQDAGNSAHNFSGTVTRPLVVGDSLATLNNAGATPDGDAVAIVDDFYPANLQTGGTSGQVPPGKTIVIFGVGPENSMIGSVLHTAPFYANTDQNSYYSRFLVAFEVDNGGGRCVFLGTLGGDGDPMRDEISEYYEL